MKILFDNGTPKPIVRRPATKSPKRKKIFLPGGLTTRISATGFFYPDKRPTQRVGIIADVEAHPTIEGIRDGRDEVLETAIRQALGGNVSNSEIQKMIKP